MSSIYSRGTYRSHPHDSAARDKRTHPIASTASGDSSFLHFLSSPAGDKRSFYVFYLRPWAMSISFTFFSFARGRKTFFLRVLASPAGEEHFFLFYDLRPRATSVFFCFTIFRAVGRVFFFCFPLIRCFRDAVFSCFFSMGLISNSHRVEAARTSSSWKSESMVRRPRETLNFATPRLEFYKYYS